MAELMADGTHTFQLIISVDLITAGIGIDAHTL